MRPLLLAGLGLALIIVACERFEEELTPTRVVTPIAPTPTVVATPVPSPTSAATPTPTPVLRPSPTPTPVPGRTPTVTPSPTPSPEPTPTQALTPTPAVPTIPGSFETYEDDVFGFQLRYPPDWQFTRGGPPQILQIGGTDEGSPQSVVFLLYQANILTSDAAVDSQIPAFLDRPGFRQLAEEELTLADGTPAFRVVYQWRETDGTWQGSLFGVAQDTQNYFFLTEAPQAEFQRRSEDIRALLYSFSLIEPTPLGITRDEALTLYFDEGPLILDPAIAQESGSIQYITQIFSGLVAFDTELNLIAELAESWELSGDGTTYTFTLRDNAMFHNGRPVTAADVKYSWERAANPANNSPTVKTYLNDIVGMQEIFSGQAQEATGIEVVDQRTLKVTIDGPRSFFLSKLAHPVAFVVDQENVDQGLLWWAAPNGTGPFKLRAWDGATLLVLEAYQQYYKTPPKVPYVVFRLYGGIPLLMYESGEIDVAALFSEDIQRTEDPQDPLSDQSLVIPELSVFYVGLASDQPPFDDPLVRRAFLLAVDRAKLVQDIYEGTREVAHGFLPPGLPGYDPSLSAIPFDPQEAQRLLAESSYGGPEGLPPVIYTTSGFAGPGDIVVAMLDMWRENLGVQVQVRLLDPASYYYNLEFQRDNIFDYGWIADYPDPHNFLDVLFHSGAENNVGKYSSAQVDALLEEARLEQDAKARVALYHEVERLLVEDAAAIPLNFGRSYVAVKPYVKDLVFTPFGLVDLRSVFLESR